MPGRRRMGRAHGAVARSSATGLFYRGGSASAAPVDELADQELGCDLGVVEPLPVPWGRSAGYAADRPFSATPDKDRAAGEYHQTERRRFRDRREISRHDLAREHVTVPVQVDAVAEKVTVRQP